MPRDTGKDRRRKTVSPPDADQDLDAAVAAWVATAGEADPVELLLRRMASVVIEGYVENFQKEGNPVYAWATWEHCRRAKIPVPNVVLDYLDGVAKSVLALSTRPPKRLGSAVAHALRFNVGGGRGSEFSRFRDLERDMELAMAVDCALDDGRGGRMSQAAAIARVAEEHGVGEQVVRRAFRKHRPRAAARGRRSGA